jgi:hypothetical protein
MKEHIFWWIWASILGCINAIILGGIFKLKLDDIEFWIAGLLIFIVFYIIPVFCVELRKKR